MQDKLDQKETDYCLMTPEEFYSALDDIEQADICRRQMKDQVQASEKATRSNKCTAADSSSDNNSCTNKKRKKRRDNKSKSSRTTAQGIARYCDLCKKAGMPYGKYSSHSTSQCKEAAKMKAKLSGGYKDCAEANNSLKKEQKAMIKEVKVLKKQKKQLMKVMTKSKSSKKERKNLHKIVNRTKSISLDSSGSGSDSSSNSDSD